MTPSQYETLCNIAVNYPYSINQIEPLFKICLKKHGQNAETECRKMLEFLSVYRYNINDFVAFALANESFYDFNKSIQRITDDFAELGKTLSKTKVYDKPKSKYHN